MYGRIRRWAVVGLLLVAGWAHAGERPFRETARVQVSAQPRELEVDEMAFTNNTWAAVSDGDWNNTSNWSLRVIPAANHIAIFDGTSQVSVTTGLDQSAAVFEQILVKPEYTGNIGSAGDPLRFSLATGVLVWRGRGQGFVNPEAGAFARVVCDVPNPLNGTRYNLVIGGMGTVISGNLAILGIKRGNVNVIGDMAFTGSIYLLGDAARLVLNSDLGVANNPKHILCAAGTLINKRPLDASQFLVAGDRSRVTQIGALVATTNVLVIGNGKFEYVPTSAPGTSPLITVIGGVYDQSDEKWDNVWGTTIIGPDASVIGGALRGSGIWPPSLDFREEYPGAQE